MAAMVGWAMRGGSSWWLPLCGVLLLANAGCRTPASSHPVGKPITIQPPLGLPAVPVPSDNPPTAETIALGRALFYEPKVSVDGTVACATCHDPKHDFSDPATVSTGVAGKRGVRNAPTVLNAAYLPLQFWDGRAITLEEQAASPIVDPVEMQNDSHRTAVSRLAADKRYAAPFRRAFGSPDVTLERVEKALASFERTLLSGDSPFDRYQYGGDKTAMTPAQIRGLAVFTDPLRGNCAVCHTLNDRWAIFSDGRFHNTGEGVNGEGDFSDVGRYHLTRVQTDTGAFLTPTLRNIANTAPYMHDGRLKTLQDVVSFYAGDGNSNPYLDKEMKSIHLVGRDRADLVDFLFALTGVAPNHAGPPSPQEISR